MCFRVFLKCSSISCIHKENKIIYSKQFGFQTGHSTDHAITQLVDQIYDDFKENKHTLGVFINLAKAFDTVDHKLLLRKMEIYGISGVTLKWFENYLLNRKQYIQISNIKNRFKGYQMRSSPGINISSSLIFDICKRPTICFKFIRPHYVR